MSEGQLTRPFLCLLKQLQGIFLFQNICCTCVCGALYPPLYGTPSVPSWFFAQMVRSFCVRRFVASGYANFSTVFRACAFKVVVREVGVEFRCVVIETFAVLPIGSSPFGSVRFIVVRQRRRQGSSRKTPTQNLPGQLFYSKGASGTFKTPPALYWLHFVH